MAEKSYKQKIMDGFRSKNPFDLEVVAKKTDGYLFFSGDFDKKKISGLNGGKVSSEITAHVYSSLPFTLEMVFSDSPTDRYGFFKTNSGFRYELMKWVCPNLEAGLELRAISLDDFKRDFMNINKRFIDFEYKVIRNAQKQGIKRANEKSRIINPQTGQHFGYSEEIGVLIGFEEETGQRQELITNAVELATKYRNLLFQNIPNYFSFGHAWDTETRAKDFHKAVNEVRIFESGRE